MTIAGGDIVAIATSGIFHSVISVAGVPPVAPTLTLSASGTTVSAAVDGAGGVTNVVRYRGTDNTWITAGSVIGDGIVTVNGLSPNVLYIFIAYSTTVGLYSLPSTAETVILHTITPSGIVTADISHLFNIEAAVYRPAITQGTYGEPIKTFAPYLVSLPCRIQRKSSREILWSDKETVWSDYSLYCGVDTDVIETDRIIYTDADGLTRTYDVRAVNNANEAGWFKRADLLEIK